jgi:molybdopterin molybdotransferase
MTTPLLPVAEAQARLFDLAPRVEPETVPLPGAAGRWLAAPVVALRTQPAADLSSMDGYAIRFADLPAPLTVIGESAAGRPFRGRLSMGKAVRIFTGAALPTGADTVMIQEEVSRQGDRVTLTGEGPPRLGANIRLKGLDFTQGTRLIESGERLTPARLALAASAGHGALACNRRLRVAIVATGDELVPPGKGPANPLALPDANSVMLAAMLADLPVDVDVLGILPDDLDALTAAFSAIQADIIVTSGGASVGDHDLIRPALQAAGGAIDFWRIAMRPGKPMLAGTLGGAVLLGLPGNPVSAFVTATLFLRPLIAAMGGATDPLPPRTTATLAEALPGNDGREDYLRAKVIDGVVSVAAVQDSSMLATLARANCLVVRDRQAPAAVAGDKVHILGLA